jgi:hypothetical protein
MRECAYNTRESFFCKKGIFPGHLLFSVNIFPVCILDSLVGWFVGGSVVRLFGCSVGWLVGWLVG